MVFSPPRTTCLGFQTAIHVQRVLSIENASQLEQPCRAPIPSLPPQHLDIARTLKQLEDLGFASETVEPLHTITNSPMRCRSSSYCYPHVLASPLPASNFFKLSRNTMCAKPALAFVQAATFLSFPAILKLGYELCGGYRFDPRTGKVTFQVSPLTTCSDLRRFIHQFPSIRGAQKARRALAYLANGSASPRETQAAILFALPRHYGGYGFNTPVMNHPIKATKKAQVLAGRTSFRCDLCWPEVRLDVEYQSREFHEGEGSRIKDSRRTNALMSMGFSVIGITNEELESLRATDVIASTIAKAIGKRSRREPRDYFQRKISLRKDLGLPI